MGNGPSQLKRRNSPTAPAAVRASVPANTGPDAGLRETGSGLEWYDNAIYDSIGNPDQLELLKAAKREVIQSMAKGDAERDKVERENAIKGQEKCKAAHETSKSLEQEYQAKTTWWQRRKDDMLLMMYSDLIDYASFNVYYDNNGNPEHINQDVLVLGDDKKYKLIRALTNSEKNLIIENRRAEILKAIRDQDTYAKTKMWLFPFVMLTALIVSLGSAAYISYQTSIAFEGIFGVSEAAATDIALGAFFVIFAVNMLIYYFSIRSVTRSLFGYGLGVGLTYESEPVLRYNHDLAEGLAAKLDIASATPLKEGQKRWQFWGMAASAVFSLSLAVITGRSAEKTFSHWMDASSAEGMAILVAVFTFVAMFCLTATAMYKLARIGDKKAAAWRFVARVCGIKNANDVKNWKDFSNGFGAKQKVSCAIAATFLGFCIYGLFIQSNAQAASLVDYAAEEMYLLGFVANEVPLLLLGLVVAVAIVGKGPFVIEKAVAKIELVKNCWKNVFTDSDALVVSPTSGLSLGTRTAWDKVKLFFVFLSIAINSFLQATPGVNNMLDSNDNNGDANQTSDYDTSDCTEGAELSNDTPSPDDSVEPEPEPKPEPPSGFVETTNVAVAWTSALMLSANSANGSFKPATQEEQEKYKKEQEVRANLTF